MLIIQIALGLLLAWVVIATIQLWFVPALCLLALGVVLACLSIWPMLTSGVVLFCIACGLIGLMVEESEPMAKK